MGAFSDLLLEAVRRGQTDLTFTVNLRGYTGQENHIPRWACGPGMVIVPGCETGVSGEQALRNFVETLEPPMVAGD